jgi:beta-glucosidase
MSTIRRVAAFDRLKVHEGNRGLGIDHEAVERRLDDLLGRMTLAQKFHELRGWQRKSIEGLYHAGGDDALGVPPFRMVDGPRGARAGKATAFPVAIARAASFDVMLERRVGLAIGREVAARGGNVLLAPTINLLRHPGWGRAQETYSEDPHHMGAMAAAFVSGAQNHVLTSPKHFAINNLENTRFELSADIGLRALHEVYLPHFRRCVREAAAASIMSAYNKVNGVYCGEHPLLLTEILRDDWGFKGFVESDWILGTRSTAPALDAGLDVEMPAGHHFTDEKLQRALAAGELDLAIVDRAVRRVLHQKLAWNLDSAAPRDPGVVECEAHLALAREAAEKSLVLLKNAGDLLPLTDRPGLDVAVVGDLADMINLGDRGSSFVTSSHVTTVLAGLEALVQHGRVRYLRADEDWGSLADADVTIVVAGLTYREEGEFIPSAQQQAEGDQLARGGDRPDLGLPAPQRALIERAAAQARRVVVVLEGGSAITVDEWLDSVDSLVMAWYPGREGGHAIAGTLFGRVNAFGRLPVSIPRATSQLMPWDTAALHVPHDLLHGYRWLDHQGLAAAFPFGFGLSYTAFEVGRLQVCRVDGGFAVAVEVRNSGPREGAAIPQLYVSCRGSSVFRVEKELKGFGRVELAAGESAVVEIDIDDEDLRYYDEDQRGWRLEPCTYELRAGQSSRDLPLSSTWVFDGSAWRHAGGADDTA